jgi:hypothetical protein
VIILFNSTYLKNARKTVDGPPSAHETEKIAGLLRGLACGGKSLSLFALCDGSGWKPVYETLAKAGYNVTTVQVPETSFQWHSRYLSNVP